MLKQSKYYKYNFKCPNMDKTVSTKLLYFTNKCLNSMKDYAKYLSCNLQKNIKKASDNCLKKCGSPNCAELPDLN